MSDASSSTSTRISGLYAIEHAIRGSPPDDRVSARQAEAEPVFDDLEAWLADVLGRIADHKIYRIEELLPWQCSI